MAQKIFTTITIGALIAMCSCNKTPHESRSFDYDSFKTGFINPPMRARPKVYWWWLNGNTDTVRLRQELVAMQQAGIGGVDIFEIGVPSYTNPDNMIPAGPAFMGEESKKTIKFAIDQATRLDFEVGFNVASSWNAGGTWTLPRNAAKSLYASSVKVKGPSKQNISLPFPAVPRTDSRNRPLLISFKADGKPVYYEDVAVLAVPTNGARPAQDTAEILNITTFFDARTEKLSWNPPAGEWNVYRYVCANSGEALKLPSPNSQAPIIDHYDSSATAAHFRFFMNELKPLLGDFSKTALKNLYLASYEATGSVWTPGLPAAFKKVNGYDIYKMIPALFDKNFFTADANRKFERDFTKTLSDLIINNHYRKAREISNKYGLKITSEAGGPGKPLHNVPVEALKALGSLDIPRGEFWNKHIHYDEDSIDIMWLVKEIAAASHIYQRKIVEEESFTSFQHWQEGPFDLKPLADRSFCEGMNRVVVHGFTHNPRGTGFPGIVYHAGTHYNDKRIWWPKIRPFNDYLARLSFVFQEADFKADVLYYYGDEVPKFVYPKNTKFKVGEGYDYEVINTEILLKDLQVKDGKLTLPGGAQFSVLSLASESEINPDVLTKLARLTKEGGVIIGEKPLGVAQDPRQPVSRETEELIDELWAPAPAQGKIISGITPLQMLRTLGIGPDLSDGDEDPSLLDYIHYGKGDLDFYLVQNTGSAWVSRNLGFRQQGKNPEIWDPVTGRIIPAPVYGQEGNHVRMPITLAPYGSALVVFRTGPENAHFTSVSLQGQNPPLMAYTEEGIFFLEEGTFELKGSGKSETVENKIPVQNIAGEWNVTFPEGWGAPPSEKFPALISWTRSQDPGIRYFSGTATYTKTFALGGPQPPTGKRLYLDLGDLQKVGDVWLNGKHLGIAWAKPYEFDITDVVRSGQNDLKVEISNTWSNRLTGDAITGEKFTKTNITRQETLRWSEVPLLESGLLGPVTIDTRTPVKQNSAPLKK